MNNELSQRWHEVLPPVPGAPGRARGLVGSALAAISGPPPALAEVAALLVSELTTNAVLHAGTDIDVVVAITGTRLRVEVGDASTVAPTLRPPVGAPTGTGHGLSIVDALADDWGVAAGGGGKLVWFELTLVSGRLGTVTDPSGDLRGGAPAGPALGRVVLRGAPPALVVATVDHVESLLRELALSEPASAACPPRRPPELDLSVLVTAARAAGAAGAGPADITVSLPPPAGQGARDSAALADRADELARAGALLCPASSPEVGNCRRWVLAEISAQLAGAGPNPYRLKTST
ncbi:MAG: ATP-binding protein [Acidimicrobiales bacterium]